MPVKKRATAVKKTSIEDIVGKPVEEVKVEIKEEKPSSAKASERQAAEETPAEGEARQGRPVTEVVQKEPEPTAEPAQPIHVEPRPAAPREYQNQYEPQQVPTQVVKGFLDIQPEGHGFLRPRFIPSQRDIYISQSQIRRFMLRPGDLVEGVGRPPKDTERYFGLLKVEKVNELNADDTLNRPYFDELVPIYPKKQVILTTGKKPLSTRIIDLIAPIGFGQRGMIVSPPKAGKTTVLKELAAGISQNFPQVHLMAALIGERPEEVTDIMSSVKGEVVASNFDEPPEDQTRVAEITLDRAKRMVEMGKDVIILLDSITRLARAYNLSVAPSGRTLSGGFDPAALWPAKKFFGAARNCQEGGSLTIIGTALVDTGSRMDDLIYEEFKGTGNMELHLDRRLADKRIYPSIDIESSGTRQEELILAPELLQKLTTMRRMLYMLGEEERTQLFIEKLEKTDTNEEFLNSLKPS
jgi:transcription termination factor Rho